MERLEINQQYLEVLTQDYVLVYDVDLYADKAEVIKLVPYSNVHRMSGMCKGDVFNYSEHIKQFCEKYVVSDKQEYMRNLDREYIIGQMKLVSQYSFRFDSIPNLDGSCHSEVKVIGADPYAFDGRVLILSREIDEMIDEENRYKRELDAEREYLDILTQDFMVAYHVNLRENTSTLIKVDRKVGMYGSVHTSLRTTNNYTERIELYGKKIVSANLRSEFCKVMSPENIVKELKKGFRYIYRYRTIEQEMGHRFFEAQVFRMNTGNNFEDVLIGFRNIDDIVTTEQKRQIELEERCEREQNQNEVLTALGRGYQAVFRIDLTKDTYERIICRDEVVMYYDKNEASASKALLNVCENAVNERFRERMKAFFNLKTLAARLNNTDSIEIECVIKDGNWHRTRFIAKRRNDAGEAVSVLYVTQVIDEEKKYQERLLAKIESADIANRAKTEFISQVAHDIRTPMNAMFGFLEIARANPSDVKTVTYALERMYKAGIFLKELISDVLDIAKMESNKIELQLANMNLTSLFDEIYETMVNDKSQQKHHFRFDTELLHENIISDKLRLKQIYINLLSNAVKYTPEGGMIELKAYQKEIPGKNKVQLIVEIKDTGIGMTDEFMDRMFVEYERAVDTRINEVSGYGLGLSIVKRLVDLMGGTIDVKSKLGEGSTFTICIEVPYIEIFTETKKSLGKINYDEVCKGLRLLVAEDNELNREVMTELLKMHGITCECVENGELCVEKLELEKEGTYNAVLMDMQMPVMNGLEATRNIRRLSSGVRKNIPIIAMTANAMTDDVQNCLDAGMNGHLSKPVAMEELLKMLVQVCMQKKKKKLTRHVSDSSCTQESDNKTGACKGDMV